MRPPSSEGGNPWNTVARRWRSAYFNEAALKRGRKRHLCGTRCFTGPHRVFARGQASGRPRGQTLLVLVAVRKCNFLIVKQHAAGERSPVCEAPPGRSLAGGS